VETRHKDLGSDGKWFTSALGQDELRGNLCVANMVLSTDFDLHLLLHVQCTVFVSIYNEVGASFIAVKLQCNLAMICHSQDNITCAYNDG